MIVVLRETRDRVHELIRDRKLASLHQLEQIQHMQMLEKQATWKREGGFNTIAITTEMHEHTLRHLHAGFDSKPLYTLLYNPRRPLTPQDFTADMNVEVGSLRLEILLAQLPPPPQYDLLP